MAVFLSVIKKTLQVLRSVLPSEYEVNQRSKMKRHNKLKVTDIKDKGFTKKDWADFILLVAFFLLLASAVFAFIIAGIRFFTESI